MAVGSSEPVSVEHELFRTAYAQRKAPLTLIVGSGLSAPAGLPTWPKLRKMLQAKADQQQQAANQFGQYLKGPKVSLLHKTDDLWLAFKLIKEILTPAVFEALVEEYLSPSDTTVPSSYTELMRLRPRGVLTLNLDSFAGDAMAQAHAGELIIPMYGKEIADRWNLIIGDRPHLVFLHGHLLNPSTWVMTHDDLTGLLASEGHRLFLQDTFMNNIVLFAGISADDIALSSRLIDLRAAGFTPKNLYWLTDRTDVDTESWAERNYVKLIRYAASSNTEHVAAIEKFVAGCLAHLPPDPILPPIANPTYSSAEPISPEELSQRSPEEIRKTISAMLTDILSSSDQTSIYEAYREFCRTYNYPVHNSFYRASGPGFDEWFGYKLIFPSIGRGNFGEVYSATDPQGELVAVKVMNENVFSNDDMLGGFRRGVRSMRIVNEYGLKGMVSFKEAFELPPTIIMPHVSGHSLEEAIDIRPDLSWLTKLKIGFRIGEIVASGHALVETILHRDLKPSNVMISNLEYDGEFDPEVVVLDFDMSWHKGSKEKDITFESRDDFGYLAPEQTISGAQYTARSTRVDSYGLGMTLYFMFGREAPRANEPLSGDWYSKILRACRTRYNGTWLSAPARLARLILRATAIEQPDRLDFASIVRELRDLELAVTNPTALINTEYWSEEVLSRVASSTPYVWDDGLAAGEIASVNGVTVRSAADIKGKAVEIKFQFMESGMSDRATVPRFLHNNSQKAAQALRAGGWDDVKSEVSLGGLSVRARAPINKLLESGEGLMPIPGEVFRMLAPQS